MGSGASSRKKTEEELEALRRDNAKLQQLLAEAQARANAGQTTASSGPVEEAPERPPGMARPEEVTDTMRERQRRKPEQWSMTMQQWVDVIEHIIKQPSYLALKKAQFGKVTMYDVNQLFVKPWTRGTGCSVALLMTREREECAKLMLSHAWAEQTEELLASMKQFFDERGIPLSTHIWFCVFGNYQPGDEFGPSIAEQLAMNPFASVIESAAIRRCNQGFGMVAIHTTTADLYDRLWCVHEVECALDQEGVDVAATLSQEYINEVNRRVTMFLDLGSSQHEALVAAGITTNTARARCGNPMDESMLIKAITSRDGGFQRLDEAIKGFRVAAIPDVVFNLERWQESLRKDVRGESFTVWRIRPGGRTGIREFPHHDQIVARMEELGVQWKEILVTPENAPDISAAWREFTEAGGLPDIIWEEGGSLPKDDMSFPHVRITTRNGGMFYYMQSGFLYAPKMARGHQAVKKLMSVFDDIPKTAATWLQRFPSTVMKDKASQIALRTRFISAAVNHRSGDKASLRMLCHSQSNYLRDVHGDQFKPDTGIVTRAYPVCIWASSSAAIVTGIVSITSDDKFGTEDMLSFWMKEGDDWRLLSITNDPVNTKEAATMQLGEWAEAHMMPYQADPGATADPPVASKAELVDTGERFKDWRWTAAEVEKPFVQVAEFHYGSNSRLFFCDSETCSVSEGQLWTTRNTWTLRVWTLKDGKLSIGPGVDFQH